MDQMYLKDLMTSLLSETPHLFNLGTKLPFSFLLRRKNKFYDLRKKKMLSNKDIFIGNKKNL